MKSFLLVYFFITLNYCLCKKYHNYTLYRGIPVKDDHLKFFHNLSKMVDVSFWRPPGLLYRPIEFTIRPQDKHLFHQMADEHGIYLTTIIPDVQKAFDMQTVKTYIRRKMETFDWRNYFRLDDIYDWLKDLNRAYPQETQLASIGQSHENRDIMAIRIVLKGSKLRSTVIVEGGIHAREWISPAFVTYFIHEILQSPYSTDTDLRRIAMTYEWFFVPVLNPDGYEYTHVTDRLWRKNRRGQFGVDLNRNFAHSFGTIGSAFDKGSEVYCGQSAFSEPESLAMAKLVQANSKNLEYYLSFHAYGQYMLIPYADMKKHIENFHEVYKMGVQAADRIVSRNKTYYSVGTAYDTVGYMTSGVSGCWVKRMFRVPYVVTFELRDDGHYGFALPPNLILPTCVETMDGIVSLLTPRKSQYLKLDQPFSAAGNGDTILDKVVFVCNVLLFIIVRYY